MNPIQRLSAKQALQEPWFTAKLEDSITINTENMRKLQVKRRWQKVKMSLRNNDT